jgi:hypothetical protein
MLKYNIVQLSVPESEHLTSEQKNVRGNKCTTSILKQLQVNWGLHLNRFAYECPQSFVSICRRYGPWRILASVLDFLNHIDSR